MNRICPRCRIEMSNNCYIRDLGKSTLSYLQLIIQNSNFAKEEKEIKACYCQKCGYVELYIDPQDQNTSNSKDEDRQQLFKTVEKYAYQHNQRLKKEQKKQHTESSVNKKKRT